MLDVLLVQNPVTYSRKTNLVSDFPRLGLLYLGAVLEQGSISVEVLENRDREYSLEQVLSIISAKKPLILGLSSMTSNIRGTYQLAQAVKERFGDEISIGLGGPHVSADPEVIKRFPVFDWAVTGEAETTFPEVVSKIKGGERMQGVFQGKACFNLDELPFPAWHLVDWGRYHLRSNNIMASRGCPFRCIFCSIPAIERRTRYRSPQRVVDEMEEIRKITGLNFYTFLDDTLTLNRKFTVGLCDEILRRGLKITFEGHTRANLVDEELIAKMKEAGLVELIFGVESGNERIRNDVIGKGISDESIFNATRLCRKYGLQVGLYLMLGFPTEGEAEIEDTVNFPQRLKPDVFGLHITVPLPGAPLWEQAIAGGVIPADTIDRYIRGELGEGFNENWPLYVPEGMTLRYLKEARTRAYRSYYFSPRYLLRKFFQDIFSFKELKKDAGAFFDLFKLGRAKHLE